MKRIGMILTGLRLDMSKPLPERMGCSDDDFETMLLIGHKLLMHSAMMFQMLPENKDAAPGEIGHTLIQKQFFEMLPTDFSKQDVIKTAEVLGIPLKTINNWLTKFTQRGAALWSQCRLRAAVAVLLPSTGCVARKLSSCGTQAYS